MRPHPGSCRRELGLEYLFRIFIFFLFCPPPRGLWLHLHLFLRAIVTLLLPLSAGRGGIASACRPAGRGGIASARRRGSWLHLPRGLWLHLHLFLRAIVTLLLPLSAGRGGIASACRPAGPLRLAAVSGLYGWRTQRMRCLALLTSLLNTSAVSVVVNVKVQASEDFRICPTPYSEPLQ